MSLATFEREILAGAKIVFCNPNLKLRDLQEWSSAEIQLRDGEAVAFVRPPGVFVAIPAANDKRKAKPA